MRRRSPGALNPSSSGAQGRRRGRTAPARSRTLDAVDRISGAPDVKTLNQDKGQATAVAEVVEAVRAGRPSPFSLEELLGVSAATLAILESARTSEPVRPRTP